MEIKSLPVQNEDGDLVPGSSATVYHMDSGDLATIYNKDGAVISNPITAGADGIIEFAAENGPYIAILTIGIQQYERFLYFSDIKEHNHSPSAHPELSAFITSEADRAEQAADAAAASGNIYSSTADGLSATTVGDYFSVPSAESDEYLILYRHDAGPVATEIKRYPSAEAVEDIASRILEDPDQPAFQVADSAGNVALQVDDTGGIRTHKLDVSGRLIVTAEIEAANESSRWRYAVADINNNILFGVTDDGVFRARLPSQSAVSADEERVYDYSINHVLTYGQSLSVGQATPVQSTTQKFDSLMFYRGQRPQYDYPDEEPEDWYASLVPAIEELSTENPSLGETPSAGTADMIKQRILEEDGKTYEGHEYQILTSAPGFGATTILHLSKPSAAYTRMMDQVGYGLALANAAGKTYAVQVVTWTQGENDYLAGNSQQIYYERLSGLIASVNADVKEITGQSKDVAFLGYQISTHLNYADDDYPSVALAQLQAQRENSLFTIATATYHLTYADGGHLTGPSSRLLGAYYGLAYKRVVINREEWRPLMPVEVICQASIIEVRFNVPSGALVFDTTTVPARPDMGFAVIDDSGAPVGIDSVSIIDTDRIRIVTSEAVQDGSKLRYAFSGETNRGQGNVRDTQGETIRFDPSGANQPMHNWCVIFEEIL